MRKNTVAKAKEIRAPRTVAEWIKQQHAKDTERRRRVQALLKELEIEQDLIALREKRRLSQSELAKLVGVSQPAIAKIESRRTKNLTLATLAKIVAALGGRLKIEVEEHPRRGKDHSAASMTS